MTEAESETAIRIFSESVAHVAAHRDADVAEVLADVEQGLAAAATGAG